jgi:hypothetical protein
MVAHCVLPQKSWLTAGWMPSPRRRRFGARNRFRNRRDCERAVEVGKLATDLDTEHGGTDVNKRDGVRQVGRLNVAGLQL